jgi:glutamine phosphoribosylpyrophosphate amidotransferase
MQSLGFSLERDVRPGEAVWFDLDGDVRTAQCHDDPILSPCVFEYVYFGRPDSVLDGISVYESRKLVREQLMSATTAAAAAAAATAAVLRTACKSTYATDASSLYVVTPTHF